MRVGGVLEKAAEVSRHVTSRHVTGPRRESEIQPGLRKRSKLTVRLLLRVSRVTAVLPCPIVLPSKFPALGKCSFHSGENKD